MNFEENNDWFNEIKYCKKLNNQNRIKLDFKKTFDKKINKNNENNLILNNNLNNNYIIKKNESLGIDKNLDKKLKTGQINIDIKVDFHGLTLDEAFDSLIKVVNYAYNNYLKCILVITGKGYGTQNGRCSIKSQFEHWMTHYEISNKVIKYVDANAKDGGSGAVYILLKTNKYM